MKKSISLLIMIMVFMVLISCGSEESTRGSIMDVNQENKISDECEHKWIAATCTEPQVCEICGDTKGNPLGHEYEGQTCTDPGRCTRCGKTIEAKGHEWTDATCTTAKECAICGKTEGEALGHSTNNGICKMCGENIFSPIEVYSDDKVIISYMGADAKGVHFDVENLTDVNITIQADSVALNGKSTNDIVMSDDVAAQSIGSVVAKCDVDYKSPVGIVSGQLRIIDFNKSFSSYEAKFTNVVVNEDVEIPSLAHGALLYEDSRVRISFDKITNNGVEFEVENLTDVNITIQADSVAINGKSTDEIVMSDDVAPQSIGTVIAKCHFDTSTKVGTVSGQLRIIDFNKSFSSYNVKIDNIIVDENVTVNKENSPGTLLYEDSKVRIYYREITSKGVVFDIENQTGANITIQADSISINKRSTNDIIMSDDVAPHSLGSVIAKCSPEYDGDVVSVGGQLRIIDFDKSFSSYNVSFTNVPVE